MNGEINRSNIKNRLRKGFSTGSTSAAAIKAAIKYYFEPKKFSAVKIKMPGGENAYLNIAELEKFRLFEGGAVISKAVAIKDSGDDDFDVTGGIKICSDFIVINKNNKKEILELKKYYEKISVYNIIKCPPRSEAVTLILASSKGVGRATRPGLPVRVGSPAVNPVPFAMIGLAASEELCFWIKKNALNLNLLNNKIFISILYIPEGEETAKKTLNGRLGIEGGISILGTTGYVIPVSTKAWLETIKASLKFLSENKINTCVYTPGRYSEKIALKIIKDLPRESFIEIGDFVIYSIRKAVKSGIKNIILAGQFGKIIKIAQGARNTNAKYTDLNLNFLGEIVKETVKNICKGGSKSEDEGGESGESIYNLIVNSNTSREAFNHITSAGFKIYSDIIFENVLKTAAGNLAKTAGKDVNIEIILISYEGKEIKRIRFKA
ncbi:MAG: cobalt-precorrin-5B (C(1))-methyltransferase CbiD [bacterium]